MATEFELALYGADTLYIETVAAEVMREIDRIESSLSFYREDSDVREINTYAAFRPVSLTPAVFGLLQKAQELSALTQGTFDITVAPLLRCWGFVGANGQMPEPEAIEQAREVVGMQRLHLDADNYTVQFDQAGVEIDLGAIGKGYAIDRCMELLREYEIECALLHGGTSSVYALGSPPDADSWQVALQPPFALPSPEPEAHLAVVDLRDTSLSVSAPHGKWFASGGRRYGHVIDPRTGYPASKGLLAALVLPSATDGDALSTGLLALGPDFLETLSTVYPDMRGLTVLEGENSTMHVYAEGIDL